MKKVAVISGVAFALLITLARADDLADAASRGDLSAVNNFIAQGVDVNAKNTNGETALLGAAFAGHQDIVKALIAQGANVNATNNFGNTAIMNAIWQMHPDIVAMLLAHGANLNAVAENTALQSAIIFKNKDYVKMLLTHGAEANRANLKLAEHDADIEAALMHPHGYIVQQGAMLAQKAIDQAGSSAAALAMLLTQFQQDTHDEALRAAIIQVAAKIHPSPQVPEAARRHLISGQSTADLAKAPQDYQSATDEFQQAANLAPWWADAYDHLAQAQEKSGDNRKAAANFKNYLDAAPNASDAGQAHDFLKKMQTVATPNAGN